MFVLAFRDIGEKVYLSAVLIVGITDFELFTYREERFTYTYHGFGALLLSKPYVVKIFG